MHFVSQGGRFFDPQSRPSFAGPVGLASAGYLSGLQQDRVCIFGQAGYSRFIQGQLPFLLDTSSKLSQLEEKLGDRLEVLPLPRGAGDRIQLSGTQLSVFAASSHSQRRAGIRLLRFLSSPEITREWSMATGYLPVRQSVYQDPLYLEFLRSKPERALLLSSLSRAQIQPQIVGWEATRIIINDALERTLYQQRPVDAEMTQAQATSAKLIRSLQGKN
jgi:ABC-type glycerol-3-phosphate transport system substrate-binding protein